MISQKVLRGMTQTAFPPPFKKPSKMGFGLNFYIEREEVYKKYCLAIIFYF